VPEWKECYYDYKTLNRLIKFIDKCVRLVENLEDLDEEDALAIDKQKLEDFRTTVLGIIEDECNFFRNYTDQEVNLNAMFVQYKLYDIREKMKKYESLMGVIGRHDHNIALLVENLFIESFYLEHTTEFNMAQESKTTTRFNQTIGNLS
jgi:hypothetical protein